MSCPDQVGIEIAEKRLNFMEIIFKKGCTENSRNIDQKEISIPPSLQVLPSASKYLDFPQVQFPVPSIPSTHPSVQLHLNWQLFPKNPSSHFRQSPLPEFPPLQAPLMHVQAEQLEPKEEEVQVQDPSPEGPS